MTTGLRGRLALFQSTVRVGKARVVAPAGGEAPQTAGGDRYEMQAELGKGGMGRVERGVDRFLGRTVALKWSLNSEPQMLQMLLREAEIASRLNHPSIVTIHDVAHDERGDPFVVMRLVDGKRLSELVAAAPDLAGRLFLLPRVLSATEATAFAHRNGIVHRDLKPDNILLGDLGETVVIDWGLALDRDEPDPFEGVSAGTPGFMSPEQDKGERVDARTDVHALGVTLSWVLSPRLPVEGKSIADLLEEAEPGVPRDLLAIVRKATARDPADRYPTAEELAAELRRFIGGQLVAAHNYTFVQRVRRWIRAHRAAVAVGVLAIIAIVVIATIALRGVLAAKSEAERQRGTAMARADQLLVDRAHSVVAEDPARALAILDLRDRSEVDVDDWAISVEALARGAPRVWDGGHGQPFTAVIPTGAGGVSALDVDHHLVVFLADGSSRRLLAGVTDLAATDDGFVAGTATEIVQFDATGRELARWPAKPNQLAVGDRVVVWTEVDAAMVHDLGTGTTRTLLGKRVTHLALDHRGHAAFATPASIEIVELGSGTTVASLAVDKPAGVAWSPASDRLLAAVNDGLLEWKAAEWANPPTRFDVKQGGIPMYFGARPARFDFRSMCVSTVAGIQVRCVQRVQGLAHDGGMVAIASAQISVLEPHEHDSAVTELTGLDRIGRIGFGRDRTSIAAASVDGRVALWRLAGRSRSHTQLPTASITLEEGRLIANDDRDVYEIKAGVATRLGPMPRSPSGYETYLMGGDLLLHSLVTNEAWLLAGGKLSRVLDDAWSVSPFTDKLVIEIDKEAGLDIVDLSLHRAIRIARHADFPEALTTSGPNIAAAWRNGHVWWRIDGRDHVSEAGCQVRGLRLGDDHVEVGCGNRVIALFEASPPIVVAELDGGIAAWSVPLHAPRIAISNRHAVYRIDDTGPVLVVDGGGDEVAFGGGRVAVVRGSDIYLYDIRTGVGAMIASLPQARGLQVSTDGRTVVAHNIDTVLRWDDPTPPDRAEWVPWKASITHATLRDPSGPLVWH